MSYSGLVADADHAKAGGEELLDQIVLFVVVRFATEVGHRGRLHERLALALLDERTLTRVPHPVGDHVHRRLERERLPARRIRSPIFDVRLPARVREQLETV